MIAYDGQMMMTDGDGMLSPEEFIWENAYDFTWVMDENEEDENTEMFICDGEDFQQIG